MTTRVAYCVISVNGCSDRIFISCGGSTSSTISVTGSITGLNTGSRGCDGVGVLVAGGTVTDGTVVLGVVAAGAVVVVWVVVLVMTD